MRRYSCYEKRCCERVRAYITSLYKRNDNGSHIFPGFKRAQPTIWTEQTPHVHACGLHVLSHIYLASQGLHHTHTFDNVFVEDLRKYCLQLLYQYRRGRHTTKMTTTVDLTMENTRFKLL